MNNKETYIEQPKVSKKIEAFFSAVESFQGQEVLVSTFKENTIAASWKLKGEKLCRGSFTFFNLYGRVQEGENSPIMVLDPIALEIFENEESLGQHKHSLYFRNQGGRVIFELEHGSYFDLTSEYHRWLIEIISKVASKIDSKKNV